MIPGSNPGRSSIDRPSSKPPRAVLMSEIPGHRPGRRECGEIGRRTRFRIWRRKAWGFKSLHSHHDPFFYRSGRQVFNLDRGVQFSYGLPFHLGKRAFFDVIIAKMPMNLPHQSFRLEGVSASRGMA